MSHKYWRNDNEIYNLAKNSTINNDAFALGNGRV